MLSKGYSGKPSLSSVFPLATEEAKGDKDAGREVKGDKDAGREVKGLKEDSPAAVKGNGKVERPRFMFNIADGGFTGEESTLQCTPTPPLFSLSEGLIAHQHHP